MKAYFWIAAFLSMLTSPALEPIPGAVFIRVVDVGAGLCCIIKTPNDRYIIYDAGNFEDRGKTAVRAASKLIPDGSEVDVMILSHTDADHLAAVPEFCKRYRIREVIHGGLERDTETYRTAVKAIKAEVRDGACINTDLSQRPSIAGRWFQIGEVRVTVVCGFHKPPDDWKLRETSEINNAGSIVARVEYRGKSVILTGDAVGRHIGDPDEACIATERYMLDNAPRIPIDSDVLIAPHHGADNGSSTAWIRAVSPDYVIFSAGHKHVHPRRATARRYQVFGVPLKRMFRTDRGDDVGGEEWNYERRAGAVDIRGDDDVDVLLKQDGTVAVNYRVRPRR